MNGIDISNWQAGIDICSVDADFVICKATEGTGFIDPTFQAHADATIMSGKLLGAYHFARTNNAEAEAEAFLGVVRPYLGSCLLALDYEADAVGNGAAWAKRWLDYVRDATGTTPIIYMSKSVCNSDDWSEVAAEYPLWAAQYPSYEPCGYLDDPWTDASGFGAWEWPAIYQYRSTGRVSGYDGNLDINKAYMTADEWRSLQGSEEDIMASKEEIASEILGYKNEDMDFKFWGADVYQYIWNAGRILTYKNEEVNGSKDVYQLLTDASKAAEKVEALEAKVGALEAKLDAVLAALGAK